MSAEDVIDQPVRAQFEAFIDEHRSDLSDCLDGLTEEQARRSLVPSRTTLLGLVKHVTVVEKVWFDEAITGRSRAEIGIPLTPDESFILHDDDTIATVQQAHREACASSRRATASLDLDDILPGNRRGPLPLRWVYLHVLRELAQHCGHADILREQILNTDHAGEGLPGQAAEVPSGQPTATRRRWRSRSAVGGVGCGIGDTTFRSV
jgi:hypothetical protein